MAEDENTNLGENNNEEEKPKDLTEEIVDRWMIKPCRFYDDEYSECTSFRGRFHQYFVYGETLDCSQWKRDSVNCYKLEDNKDVKAGKELVEAEKVRRKERLLPHYRNDVWEKRKEPPEDWNKPLPDYLQKEYENSYLHFKSRELRGEMPPTFDPDWKYCAIM